MCRVQPSTCYVDSRGWVLLRAMLDVSELWSMQIAGAGRMRPLSPREACAMTAKRKPRPHYDFKLPPTLAPKFEVVDLKIEGWWAP